MTDFGVCVDGIGEDEGDGEEGGDWQDVEGVACED